MRLPEPLGCFLVRFKAVTGDLKQSSANISSLYERGGVIQQAWLVQMGFNQFMQLMAKYQRGLLGI